VEIIMQMPEILQGESLTRLAQGAFAGFVATVLIGFGWAGWTLGSTAKENAVKSAAAAVVAVLAPICADKFQHAAEAPANLVELKKTSTWQQDTYIEKGGWATFPGMSAPDRTVAQACDNLLTAL
jgi:predicted negative regulator of RcsB-dependent stress response